MKILVDMNLSPTWCEVLRRNGWECVHWSEIGDPRAADTIILTYAKDRGYVVFTHDLDFSAILAATRMRSPSVIQIRAQDVMSDSFQRLTVEALRRFQAELETGALVVIDESRSRARILPLA
jgi:predicted nuclease of predicted toxin-antitoxin system